MAQKIDIANSRFQLYVKEYNEASKLLILIAVFDDLEMVNIDPFNMMDVFQEAFSRLLVELVKMEIALELLEGNPIPGLDGAEIVLQSDYILDYIEPVGMMPPSLHEFWDKSFQYYKIELVYRGKSKPPTSIPKEAAWEPVEVSPGLNVWMPNSFDDYLADWNATSTRPLYLARATKHYWSGSPPLSTNPDDFGVFVQIHPILSQFIQAMPGVFEEFPAHPNFAPWYGYTITEAQLQLCWQLQWPSMYLSQGSYVQDLFEHPALDLFETEQYHKEDIYGDIATPGYLSFGWDPDWNGTGYPSWYDKWMTMRSRIPTPYTFPVGAATYTGNFLARLYYWFEHNFRKFWLYWHQYYGVSRPQWMWADYHGDDFEEFKTLVDQFAVIYYGSVDSPNVKPAEIGCDWMAFTIAQNLTGNSSRPGVKYPVDTPYFPGGGILPPLAGLALMQKASARWYLRRAD